MLAYVYLRILAPLGFLFLCVDTLSVCSPYALLRLLLDSFCLMVLSQFLFLLFGDFCVFLDLLLLHSGLYSSQHGWLMFNSTTAAGTEVLTGKSEILKA